MSIRLVLDRISHSWGDLKVLDGITLTAEPGEVTTVIGPSGCGKSTLLNIIGGLLAPSSGTVRTEGEIAADCLNPLTYVFQDFSLLPWRDVQSNVGLVLRNKMPAAARAERVREVLALTGLSDFADAWPRELSGGMKQRVGIARALAVRPACLLMDEPLSALDAQTRDLLLDEFVSIIGRSGTTTVYITHNLSEAVRLGNQIVVMSRRPGQVREIFRVEQPLSERSLDDPELKQLERTLWHIIRDDAAVAERERIDAPF
jgi:NitT/TauT family transport system ATP-binding protein